ncbi:hypothetical protein [Cytobacillus praedii]|nr:hypothetical protein [Cytobacillus praedii]
MLGCPRWEKRGGADNQELQCCMRKEKKSAEGNEGAAMMLEEGEKECGR